MTRINTILLFIICAFALKAQYEPFPFNVKDSIGAIGSVYIENLITGDVPVDINGDVPMIPASVTKLITAATVLENTPKDFRYETSVYATGAVQDSILKGNIIIKASGDPTLESRHFEDYRGVTDSIANSIQHLGINAITGNIIIKHESWMEEPTPEGWMDSDLPWYYGAGFHALNFRDNCVIVTLPSGLCNPPLPESHLNICKSRQKLSYSRTRGGNILRISGKIPKKGAREKLANPNPSASLIAEIEEKLKEKGITILHQNSNDKKRHLIYTHESPTLLEILQSTMYRSDNTMAEAMLKLSLPGKSRKQAAEKEISLWGKRDVDINGIIIQDGSGLSRDNRLTAYFLAEILVWKAAIRPDPDFVSLFPLCGEQGTVRNFLKNTPLQGKIALKSGSMNGVKCYAGYALDDNGMPTYAIVIMANRFKGNMQHLKKAMEDLLLQNIS